ncbi:MULTISPECIES: winged helix-turn-helix domain-containing protein [Shewanella]|uniref:Helix-turn-helix domain-containing protein n=1 Tax=Shewanella fidelis TaxID=173509 RepID=A0AAW8NS98_9GAMM|nr:MULTISPECIES: helix-turn-helix domain-containing protein [Shewanella]MDR8525657.1 helix-turn-helix domain-containing protein [Shewanella fidelis]MDW4812833.1 helix-turn-helix domain-containing protein [Shewanella fidelis]MDW4816581.1 helix-turn-helix domain-containing protein [Shewanella fidelis]MDW4820255.1 helix-turn-helix domain-containing protein [Shewanella fidelis]MDW4825298.1 helix-turn-helix domain-containing protein [Shewanella fidelis]
MQLTSTLSLNVVQQHLFDAEDSSRIELSFAETAVLQLMLKHQGTLITREALLEAGWHDRVVSASSLQQCISVLRKKLASYPEVELKTIPRHGYVLHLESKHNQPSYFKKPKAALLFTLAVIASLILLGYAYINHDQAPYNESLVTSSLSNVSGNIRVFTPAAQAELSADTNKRLKNQISDEPNWQAPFSSFSSFALLTDKMDSFAICPNYQQGQCSGKQLINITSETQHGSQLALSDFLTTKIRMEQKTYNKLDLPELKAHQGDLKEQIYHGDLYFAIDDHRLVRSDMRISLVDLAPDNGIFYFAACITDEDCYTTPIRYEIRGQFKRTTEKWQQRTVERFDVEVSKTTLSSPNALSDTAQIIYLALRKQHLTQEQLSFYRVYQDDGTAIWQLPLVNDNIMWMQRQTLKL